MREDKLWRVYGWRNIHTDEWYVGCTSRFMGDRAGNNLIQYLHNCPKFSEAIKEYGSDAFEQNILRLCTTKEEAIYWEQYWVKKLDSMEHGYNINLGTISVGHAQHLWTDEERQRARERAIITDPRENEKWKQLVEEGIIPSSKAVRGVNLETGEVVEFDSKSDAARFIEPSCSFSRRKAILAGINRNIRGLKFSAYGFKWERV